MADRWQFERVPDVPARKRKDNGMDTLKLKFAALAMVATLTLTSVTVSAVNPANYVAQTASEPVRLAAGYDLQAARAIGLTF